MSDASIMLSVMSSMHSGRDHITSHFRHFSSYHMSHITLVGWSRDQYGWGVLPNPAHGTAEATDIRGADQPASQRGPMLDIDIDILILMSSFK